MEPATPPKQTLRDAAAKLLPVPHGARSTRPETCKVKFAGESAQMLKSGAYAAASLYGREVAYSVLVRAGLTLLTQRFAQALKDPEAGGAADLLHTLSAAAQRPSRMHGAE